MPNYVVIRFVVKVVTFVTGSRAVPTTVGNATIESAIHGIQQRNECINAPANRPPISASGRIWTVNAIVVTTSTHTQGPRDTPASSSPPDRE